MQPETRPIKTLLLRIFLPAVLLVAALLAVFAYNWHYATILEGFDRKLVTTSALTGALIDPEDHDILIDAARAGTDPETVEQTPEYERNAAPIRRILTQLNLTYLYSQATATASDIVYVLDASVGDEHSPIGTPDDLSPQTLNGIRSVESDLSIFVSPIEYQEQWGLIKTAAAPIYGNEGQVRSTAGADVNISLILVATQNALFASTLIGLGSIALCLLITFAIVRKVARPIELLKDRALSIAAGESPPSDDKKGQRKQNTQVQAPREVVRLSAELSNMAAEFELSEAKREQARADENRKANVELISADDGPILSLLHATKSKVFWLPAAADTVDAALAARAMTLLARRFSVDAKLAQDWRILADTQNGLCIEVCEEAETIELVGSAAAYILREGTEIALKSGSPEEFVPETDLLKLHDGPAFQLPLAAMSNGMKP